MSKTSKWVIAILILLIALFFVNRWRKGASTGTAKVAVEKVSRRTIVETVSASGKIFPENEIKITPEFSGQVTELKVREGEYVKKGQHMATIGNRTVINAPMDGIISSLKVKKGESVAGNTFNVGTEMMTVADMSVLELRVDVSENDIVKVAVGDTAEIEVDAYNNRVFTGIVTQISNSTKSSVPGLSSANDATDYQVRIRMDKESYKDLEDSSATGKRLPFRPAMNASASIRTQRLENILTVPITAVTARMKDSELSLEEKNAQSLNEDNSNKVQIGKADLQEIVFTISGDTARKVIVQSGIQDVDYIEIKSGLKEGEQVVVAPFSLISRDLKNGTKVKIVPRNKIFEN